MYERKVARAYRRGGLISCGAAIVGAIVGIAMLATILFLIRGGDIEPRSPRMALALATPAIFTVGILALAAFTVAWRGRRVDRAFEPWNLDGSQWGAGLRSWHGEIDGRQFDAWLHRGPTLELFLDAAAATRGVVHRGGPWIQALTRSLSSREPLRPAPLDLDGASIYAEDPEWMRKLLSRPEAESAIRELMTETSRTATAVFIGPDAVKYMRRFLPLSEMNPENLRQWTRQLAELAAAIDTIGPSADGTQPTRMEIWARKSRGNYANRMLLILGAVMVASMLALFLFGWWNIGTP